MVKKSVKKAKAKSKKSPKVGKSKKAKTTKASKAKKQTARTKAASKQSKIKRNAVAIKKAKAKKNKKEVKKTPSVIKKITKPAENAKKANANDNSTLQHMQRVLEENSQKEESNSYNQDPAKAPGKRHLNFADKFRRDHAEFETQQRQHHNDIHSRPEAFGKRGRSSSPRATVPTN